MKHTEDELKEQTFFRLQNALTKRFFSGENINLAQLDELVKKGEVQTNYPIIANQDWHEVVKKFVFQEQEVILLRIRGAMKGKIFMALLGKMFMPISGFDESENQNLEEFIVENIVKDNKIFYKDSKKRSRFPAIYTYGRFKDGDPLLMYYMKYDNLSKLKVARSGASYSPTYYPQYVSEPSLVLVTKGKG